MCAGLVRAWRRNASKLLRQAGIPATAPWPLQPCGLMLALALLSLLCLLVLTVFAPSKTGQSTSDRLRGPKLALGNISEELVLLRSQDLTEHATEHWRMLLPGTHDNFEDFLTSVLSGLRARPLGRPCLNYFLKELAQTVVKGDPMWLEFGVWKGQSLQALGTRSHELGRKGKVFGFDSFKGLPEVWRNSSGILGEKWAAKWTQKGSFDIGGSPPPEYFVDPDNADFVVGWFNESLPPFLLREAGQVGFVHVDSDLYSSALTALRGVTPRLRSGAVIVFDELINYPGFRDGEVKALYEWIESQEFRDSGLMGVQIIGYRGPNLLGDDAELAAAIREQRGEGRKYPQDAIFRVW
eukprot:gnl/TRDRNA2_/TRDRNA2_81368_c0_seq2.p1 gnl/TRDRNA2_/TRDRNA2_81368_c0~~gnl/TRDRNA2_/TRDRNA2_81368_c0_seq2.p1  ORF type:complete len:353 (+),score=68.91 gnl/TRDRNA2_/TRDRNA2_81368_c0_seq2:99-1157(+)